MKRLLLFAAMTALTLSLASCGPEAPKNLVLYYSSLPPCNLAQTLLDFT